MNTEAVADPAGIGGEAMQAIDPARVKAALTRAVFEQGVATLGISACCLFLCFALLHGAVPTGPLIVWLVAGLVTVVLRAPLVALARKVPDSDLPFRRNVVLVGSAGCVWGALPFFQTSTLPVHDLLVLILFPITMSIAVVCAYGPRRVLFFAFALPAQLPLVGVFLFAADGQYAPLALPALLSLAGQSVLSGRYQRQIREMVELRFGRERLLADMAGRNAALALANEEANEANAVKSEFLARMSHEIRTPMNGVVGLADLLGRTNLNAEQEKLLTTMNGSARVLLDLLDELLDISHVETGALTLAPCDYSPRSLLSDALAPEQSIAESRGLSFDWSVDAVVPTRLHGDVERLTQLVRHLVENAVRFTESGGVEIRVGCEGSADARRLTLRVTDTGIGIGPELIEHVFEPFRQGDGTSTRRVGGSGLGLALVREIVSLMDGRVTAQSTLGAGSTFVVELPLLPAEGDESATGRGDVPARREAGEPHASPVSSLPATPGEGVSAGTVAEVPAPCPIRATVLVAEDNPVNQMVIEAMLEGMGCAVHVADDGAEALEALAESAFDIVFMDCQMPVVDGLSATREARDRGLQLPIVAVTANVLDGDRERCLASGMNDYLAKPFTSEALAAMIDRWAGGQLVAAAASA